MPSASAADTGGEEGLTQGDSPPRGLVDSGLEGAGRSARAPRTTNNTSTRQKVSLLASRVRMRADTPASPLRRSRARPMGQRGHAAHGSAARQGRPGRVLGLLPRQLAAHAAVPEGLARALRRRRACGSSACTPAGSSRRASEENVRRAVERLEIPWPVADRHRPRGLGHLRQRGLAGALPVGPASSELHSLHYGEGAYVETELEIQALLGVSREPLAPLRPEDAPDALIAAADRGPAGRLLRPVRGGRRVGGRRGRGRRCASTAREVDGRRAGLRPR